MGQQARYVTVETAVLCGLVDNDLARVLGMLGRVDEALGPLQGLSMFRAWRRYVRSLRGLVGGASRALESMTAASGGRRPATA